MLYMHASVVSEAGDTCQVASWKCPCGKRALFTAEDAEVFVLQSLHLQLQATNHRLIFSCNLHYKSYLQAAAFTAQIYGLTQCTATMLWSSPYKPRNQRVLGNSYLKLYNGDLWKEKNSELISHEYR